MMGQLLDVPPDLLPGDYIVSRIGIEKDEPADRLIAYNSRETKYPPTS